LRDAKAVKIDETVKIRLAKGIITAKAVKVDS